MISLIYSILNYHGLPDEIIAKIIYEFKPIKHPCSIIINKYFDELQEDVYDYDTSSLVECFLCGNVWDGNAQCNCLY